MAEGTIAKTMSLPTCDFKLLVLPGCTFICFPLEIMQIKILVLEMWLQGRVFVTPGFPKRKGFGSVETMAGACEMEGVQARAEQGKQGQAVANQGRSAQASVDQGEWSV